MKVVLQDGVKDCGICSLLSVIRYYGGDVSKEYLRELTNTTKNGVSAYNLIDGAKKMGFIASGVFGELFNIDEIDLPCLAHVIINKNCKHFVVIYKINKIDERVIIMDPAKGKRVLSFAEFKLLSTNHFIFLKPSKNLPCFLKRKIIKKTIFLFIRNKKLDSIFVFLLTFSYFIFNILTAFHFKYLLEISINYKIVDTVYFISYILFILYLFKICNYFFRNILLMKFMMLFDLELTHKTFKQILLLPYIYYKNRTTGEVINKLKDLTVIKSFFSELFCSIITDVIRVFLFLFFMFKINLLLSLLIFLLIFLLGIFLFIRSIKEKRLFRNVCRKQDQVNSYLIESLSNVDTIKGSHLEKRLADTFLLKYHNLLDKNYKYSFFIEVNQFFKQGVSDLIMILVYGIGSYLVINGDIRLGELFVYQVFFTYLLESCHNIFNLLSKYPTFKIALERVEDLYTISSEDFSGFYYYFSYDLNGCILIKDFDYKIGNKFLFKRLNLTIKSGEKVLLMGPSGSGKSSLVKILMRYLEVPFGYVQINGIDINHYHLESLRNNITYVSSHEFLFTDSLYQNIVLHKEISQDDLLKVIKISRVNEIINDDFDQLQMMVEENGFNFSHGERQRIILARALLRKSDIYIFDEALGQIDLSREKKILEEMFLLLKDKTVIVISHRSFNKKLYDKVLKLENGSICYVKGV